MFVELITVTVIVGILGFFMGYILVRAKVAALSSQLESLDKDYKVRFNQWIYDEKKRITEEVLKSSRATLKGKIGEQLAPLLPLFKYNVADARFIGSPIDYVIFDGYTDFKEGKDRNKEIRIVLMDVKTGKDATLTPTEKKIKEAVEEKHVYWDTLRIGIEEY